MIYKIFSEFKENVATLPHRLLALDVGTKTVGTAISDSGCRIASPLKTIQRKGKLLEISDIKKTIDDYSVKSLIVGYPIHMNGDEGERCEYVHAYAAAVTESLNLPVLLWDERMSTMSAERMLLEGDMSRAKRKDHIDSVAASIILQSFLDFFGHQPVDTSV
ncbi:Holliday junction resolvase RuvX [Candidatus Bodocaedibacter vickermanii]|uniref:Putative pre-16S rRNA nuclease n=1 Tax=Candidatus Bodocaedibacter vickermanii TaxID=2741701 RepID=A0A7L9RTA1_9PROT|nr:Holliday junction resolvase RuvX [Candidatus Paracaedibacteraceae bacterium 'Lake Konstanz']